MNANQMADILDTYTDTGMATSLANTNIKKVVTMLRQQQAEIAELKHMNKNWQISENILLLELEKLQQRELTDEEIDELSKKIWERPWLEVHRKFAKAILRKAQEK